MSNQTYRLSIEVVTESAKSQLNNLKKALQELEKGSTDAGKDLDKLAKETKKTGVESDKAKGKQKEFAKALKDTENNSKGLSSTIGSLRGAYGALMGVAGTLATTFGISAIVQTQREFDVLNAQLVTATGSTEKASEAFASLQEFASTTPYGLAQSVEGFAKLKNLGLDPSIDSLTSFGNTASAMGKDLNQMIEAVADASTGEFERLKEFGIKASKEKDKVSFTFQGVTTTVKNNAKDIQKYLLDIGNVNFAGAMELRAKTLDGAISALGDSWDMFKLSLSQGGIGELMAKAVAGASIAIDGLTEKLKDPVITEQFKAVIGTIGATFEIAKIAIDNTVEALAPIGDFITNHGDLVLALSTGLLAGATAYGAITLAMGVFATAGTIAATVTGALAGAMAVLTSPITLIAIAIGALVAAGVYLYKNWDTVKAKADEVWFAIGEIVAIAVENVKSYFGGIGEWFGGVWENIKTAVSTKIDEIKQAFFEWLAGMPAPVQEMVANIVSIFDGISAAWEVIKVSAQNAWQWVKDTAHSAIQTIMAVWQDFTGYLSGIWDNVKVMAKSAWDSVVSFTKPIIDTLVNIIKIGLATIVGVWQLQFTAIKTVVGVVFGGIKAYIGAWVASAKAIFTAGLTMFASVFNANFALIKNIFATTFNAIKALVRGDMEGVKTAIFNGIQNAWNIVKTGAGNIVREFAGLGGKLRQAGIDAIAGFIGGIQAKMKEALDVAKNLANSVWGTVKSALDIRSPSRKMKELGVHTADGMTVGIKKGTSKAIKQAQKMAEDIKKAVADNVSNLKREIALFGDDSPINALKYDIGVGKYGKVDTKELESLTTQKYALERNKIALDEIFEINKQIETQGLNRLEMLQWEIDNTQKYAGILPEHLEKLKVETERLTTAQNQFSVQEKIKALDEKILLVGKSELEILQYQLDNAKEYQGVSDEIKQTYLDRTRALQDEIKANERLNALQKARDDFAKQQFISQNPHDKYAGQRFDLQKQGFDGGQIDEMVGYQAKMDAFSAFQNLQNTLKQNMPKNPMVDLQAQFDERLAIIRQARQSELGVHMEFDQAEIELSRQFLQAKNELMITQSESLLGGMAQTAKTAFGEQSKAYRMIFAMEKGMAIARSVMAIQTAMAQAAANPFPMNLGAMATVASQVANIVGNIKAVAMPIGQAHDGIMSVPKSGTWNLEKGERVLPKHTAKALDDKLNTMGGGGQTIIVNVTVNSDGTANVDSQAQMGKQMGEAIKVAVQQEFIKQQRQGGVLYGR